VELADAEIFYTHSQKRQAASTATTHAADPAPPQLYHTCATWDPRR
jgi:hypothetical protein